MSHFIKIMIFGILFLTLTACAAVGKVPTLTEGSRVAIITSLDNKITYDYVGTTVFQNTHFQYDAPRLNIDGILINKIKSALERSGYNVTVIHVPGTNPLTNFSALSSSLSDSEKNYLMQLTRGKRVQRAIVINKWEPYIYETPTENAKGYGYFNRSMFGLSSTTMFGAVSIAAIDMSSLTVEAFRAPYLLDEADKSLYAESVNQVNPQAVNILGMWIHEKFSNTVLSDMQKMGVVR